VSPLERLARDYRVALLSYLPRREEAALNRGYELGRSAVIEQVGLLELARVHHDVFLAVLEETQADDVLPVAAAASEFLMEVLATFDMTQRSLHESRPAARGPRPGGGVTASRSRAEHAGRTRARRD
jgi:hypothetical protein